MDRLTFLQKARQLACQLVEDSSCLTDAEFADIQADIQNEAMNEEEALTQKAKIILEDAAADIE